MDTTTKKIGIACFIGGVLGFLTATLVTPTFWWLGLLAGFGGGYVTYEFRAMFTASARAFRETTREIDFSDWDTIKWLRKPHFIFYQSLFAAVLLLWVAWNTGSFRAPDQDTCPLFILGMWWVIASLVFLFVTTIVSASLITFLLYTGDNDIRLGFGYRQGFETQVKGIGVILKFIFWTILLRGIFWVIPTILLKIVIGVPCFLGRFAWAVFKLIHSDKRLLCGIDGAIGGAVAYISSLEYATSLAQTIVFAIFGGLLGATFGILNFELVSKRWLKLEKVVAK